MSRTQAPLPWRHLEGRAETTKAVARPGLPQAGRRHFEAADAILTRPSATNSRTATLRLFLATCADRLSPQQRRARTSPRLRVGTAFLRPNARVFVAAPQATHYSGRVSPTGATEGPAPAAITRSVVSERSRVRRQVVAFLRAALKLSPSKLDLDPGPVQLAARLIEDRDPTEFLRQLVERHRRAKLESPWVALVGNTVEILTPNKNLDLEIRPRTYRLDAFSQLLRDLGMFP